jgi:hypothetical protein
MRGSISIASLQRERLTGSRFATNTLLGRKDSMRVKSEWSARYTENCTEIKRQAGGSL